RPLPLDDLDAVEPWLKERRQAWFAAIKYPELRWSLQRRVDTSCGAATFLAFRLDPPEGGESADGPGPVAWTAWAMGDVCLFQTREARLIKTFPVTRPSEFGYTPPLYQSKPLLALTRAQTLRGETLAGDLLIFATDALAQWMMATTEADRPPDWRRYLIL